MDTEQTTNLNASEDDKGDDNSQKPPHHEASPFILNNGIPVAPSRGEQITTEHIRQIMEDEGI